MFGRRVPLFHLLVLFYTAHRKNVYGQDPDSPDLSPRGDTESKQCTARNGQPGLCVSFSYCNNAHTILPGGDISGSELRERKVCPDSNDQVNWCCTLDGVATPPVVKTKNDGRVCTAPDSDECPWCVSIYKSTAMEMTSTGLFCMGAMVVARVVLTASSCILAAQKQQLWVKVPQSEEPNRNYKVEHRILHPYYNSGSHKYDFGLLVLEDDVKWRMEEWMGACLGLHTPHESECVAYGFDANNNITSTLLTVKTGSCSNQGGVPDAACGTIYDEPECLVSIGSPVVCRSGNNYLVAGVARNDCYGESVLLGRLSLSADWLTKELNTMKVDSKFYQISPTT